MSFKFSKNSLSKLMTCDERLQKLMFEVIKYYDFTVLEGHREESLQNLYFEQGKSKLSWPNSKHNQYPSKAIDIAPYHAEAPHIRWSDRESFYFMAGIVKGIASQMGIKIRHGGDWNMNNNLKDQTFFDLPHFELVEKK